MLKIETHYYPAYLSNAEVYLSMALQPFVGPWPLFQFLDFYTVDRTPWTGDQPVARPLLVHRTARTQNKHTQTYASNRIRNHDPSV
jgi:hypothetical protein